MNTIVHHSPGLNSKPFHSMYVEKAYMVILLIAIRPSDGDVIILAAPLVLFKKSRL